MVRWRRVVPRTLVRDLTRIRARPDLIQISHGRSVFITDAEGCVGNSAGQGLYVDETRLISRWGYLINGVAPIANASSVVQQHRWCGYFVTVAPGSKAPPKDHGSGQVPDYSRQTLELYVSRTTNDGLCDEVQVTNYSSATSVFELTLRVDADFADQIESDGTIIQREVRRQWLESELTIRFEAEWHHDGRSLRRGAVVSFEHNEPRVSYAEGTLTWRLSLPPGQGWRTTVRARPVFDELPSLRVSPQLSTAGDVEHSALLEPLTSIDGDRSFTAAQVKTTIDQARSDLAAMRMPTGATTERGWTVAAGLPLYLSLFGRDTLTAGWQAGLLGPELMIGALDVLASMQGTVVDDWRDEQPGKMLHEAHAGPLAQLGWGARDRSYSSITTSGLYAFVLAELWHWTGDRDLVRRYVEPALRALAWLDRDGDPDGDGFYEYEARSPVGPVHQAWKDSPDAIVHEDGSDVDMPIATCEEQAFVYAAKVLMAETMWSLGEPAIAERLALQAAALKKRFNEIFWMEEEGTYALALDGRKRLVRTIASNAGHCIAAGIADTARVRRIADRLFQPDLFSGWGIRTLSTNHPRYNPFSYHLGSVWPVEQGTFALGFWRYGLHDRVQQLARAQFEAASMFEHNRVPELFGGHARDREHPFPGIYPNSNPLQAWSSSSVLMMLQAMLGLYPYAPLDLLVLDPHLPEWFPEVVLRDLRIGASTATIRFRRGNDGRTRIRVIEKSGPLRLLRQPSPWSLTTNSGERIADVLASLAANRRWQ